APGPARADAQRPGPAPAAERGPDEDRLRGGDAARDGGGGGRPRPAPQPHRDRPRARRPLDAPPQPLLPTAAGPADRPARAQPLRAAHGRPPRTPGPPLRRAKKQAGLQPRPRNRSTPARGQRPGWASDGSIRTAAA